MALAQINGFGIVEARVLMPSSGNWTADLVVDAVDASGVIGAVAMDLGASLRLRGTAMRVGSAAGQVSLRVVGGNGGLSDDLEPKAYRDVPLRLVLQDLAADAGEQLSPAIIDALLSNQLDRWNRFNESAGECLNDLADRTGYGWRVLHDGSLWMGLDTFPAVNIDAELLRGDPHLGRVELGAEAPVLVPGVSILGRNIDQVEHLVKAGRVRTVVTFQ